MDGAWTRRDDAEPAGDSADGNHRTSLYRKKARDMRIMAATARNFSARREFIALARGYELLAGRALPENGGQVVTLRSGNQVSIFKR